MTRLLTATLAACVMGLAIWFGGLAGVGYLGLYAFTLVPGLPIGWRLFGRANAAGWIAGALFGYGLTALAFWIPIRLGVAGAPSFAIAWVLLVAAAWLGVRRGRDSLCPLPAWQPRDTALLLLLLHLVPVLLAMPFGRAGERDRTGTRYYRAYFTADFVWHAALTQELARWDRPPINPYLAPEPIHYYWTYFIVPAALAGSEDAPRIGTEAALKINAMGTALLLFGMIFCTAWGACGRAGPAAAASLLVLLAPSLEGTYEIVRLLRAGAPLDVLRETNIDAVTAWPPFRGLRIDGLVRSMWWTPQHATSMALGLIGVLAAARPTTSWRGALLAGGALGLSVTMNPFLGAAFCAIYGLSAVIDIASRPRPLAALLAQATAAAPVAAGLLFGIVNRMSEGAGGAITFGWLHLARQSPVATFLLSFGGVLILVLLGLVPWRRQSFRQALPGLCGLVVGCGLMYFVSITDRAWVGFRAGNILLTTMPMLAARGLAGMIDAGWRTAAVTAAALLLVAGAPTTVVDTFNAQDVENRRMGPGFLWTIPLTPAQQAGFEWIRQVTPPGAIVQADPVVRGRQNWSVIPSFAGRRMAAGLPISLLEAPEYTRRSNQVHALLTSLPVEEAHAAARALGIEYLWLDQDDGTAAAETMNRFAMRPDLFAPAFRRGDVVIYRVTS